MPFITYETIAADLPQGHDPKLVSRVLRAVARKLDVAYNIRFEADQTNQTLALTPYNHEGQGNFTYWYFKKVQSVKIKDADGNTVRLLEPKDYALRSLYIRDESGEEIHYQVELNCQISPPYYLEVTADTGHLQCVPQDLIDALVDYISRRSNLDAQGGQIQRAKTGESEITYSDAGRFITNLDPLEDEQINKAISYLVP